MWIHIILISTNHKSHIEVEDCKNVDVFHEMGQSSLIVTFYGYDEKTQVHSNFSVEPHLIILDNHKFHKMIFQILFLT